MIPVILRVLLVVGSLLTAAFILYRIRSAKLQIRDSIFWIVFSLLLFLLSLFPGVAIWAAEVLEVQSPINFVYLFIIFILLVQLFSCNIRISQLDAKIKNLVQRMALDDNERDKLEKK